MDQVLAMVCGYWQFKTSLTAYPADEADHQEWEATSKNRGARLGELRGGGAVFTIGRRRTTAETDPRIYDRPKATRPLNQNRVKSMVLKGIAAIEPNFGNKLGRKWVLKRSQIVTG
jgi:hypothetical protein